MPKECVNCGQALEELVQEIRQLTTKNDLAPKVAAQLEQELQAAIAAANKDPQDLEFILGKLQGAKTFIAGDAAARGLFDNFAETITLVQSHLP